MGIGELRLVMKFAVMSKCHVGSVWHLGNVIPAESRLYWVSVDVETAVSGTAVDDGTDGIFCANAKKTK